MAQPKTQNRVKITRPLLTKALVWLCPRFTRQGSKGEPAWACSNFDGTFSNCVGLCEQCSQVMDVYQTMAKIGNGEIEVL